MAKTPVTVENNKLPAEFDYSADAGSGFEDVTANDLVLPFWKLLQSAHDETKRSEAAYIKGAAEGLWLDTVTKRLFRDIVVVPVKFVTHYIEWKKRIDGGGLVRNHGTNRSILDTTHRDEKTGRDTNDQGHEIITTATWFVLVISGKEINPSIADDEGTETELMTRAVITFSSTALKASRGWISLAQAMIRRDKDGVAYHPPLFAMSYLLTCVGTRNDLGSWVLPVVKQAGWIEDYSRGTMILQQAREYHKLAAELHQTVVTPRSEESSNGSGGRTREYNPRGNQDADKPLAEDIPF
jgi:hypothetical protein